jgi:flagellar motility protein MotE (MotC chaperone)
MNRLLQSSWFAVLIGGLAYLGATFALFHPERYVVARESEPGAKQTVMDEPSWKFKNPEFDQWVEEIQHQRDALALREQQLQELQTRLETERQELNTATQTVFQLQSEFDKNVIRIKDQEADNLKRQAKIVSTMSPESAAALVNDMNPDEAVRVLATMKADEASAVLEALGKLGKTEAKHAALLTENMRRVLPPPTAARAKPSS